MRVERGELARCPGRKRITRSAAPSTLRFANSPVQVARGKVLATPNEEHWRAFCLSIGIREVATREPLDVQHLAGLDLRMS